MATFLDFLALFAFSAMVGSWVAMAAGTAALAAFDLWELWAPPARHNGQLTTNH